MWCCEQAFQARLSRCVMSPTCLDGIRALIYLWLGICYSLWHCNCLYFIGCLKQFNMVGSRRGCIPAETQQVRAGWLEALQCSLLLDSRLPRAMEALPKNGASDFFHLPQGHPPQETGTSPVRYSGAITVGVILSESWPTNYGNEPPAGSNRVRV